MLALLFFCETFLNSEWESECYLRPNEQFATISWREHVTFHEMTMTPLCQVLYFSINHYLFLKRYVIPLNQATSVKLKLVEVIWNYFR